MFETFVVILLIGISLKASRASQRVSVSADDIGEAARDMLRWL
jgi:hypothetical protein